MLSIFRGGGDFTAPGLWNGRKIGSFFREFSRPQHLPLAFEQNKKNRYG
jgi:hypothetical protein